ncbi:nuclease-related domain-containing protein, partial [Stenotrophomonas maltophilia group sp. RNC7]|uniref:nuclease-related domain-containing protein n=1 Tax=Stenotrophomonas maltophilia group sp. RNC7 TaxID=3071467 RepID=UPI0027E0BF92
TLYEISQLIDESDQFDAREKVELKLKTFNKYISWSENDYEEYNVILNELKRIKRKENPSNQELGNALENLVDFILEKSYFYKVYTNKRTGTHEIDQFAVISDRGIQAITEYNFAKDLLLTNQNYFVCECKNYKGNVGATWVGKFNTLLEVSGRCQLGIIFSCDGLTGKENTWYDSHGLTKVIFHMSNSEEKRYILDFNMNDFNLLKSKEHTFFSIVKSKKASLISGI